VKIRTQSFLLIVGVAAVPVLVLSLTLVVLKIGFSAREAARFEQHKAEWQGKEPSDDEVIRDLVEHRPRDIDLAIGDPSGVVIYSTIPAIRAGERFGDELLRATTLKIDRERILSFGFTPQVPAGYAIVASVKRSSLIPSELLESFIVAMILALAAIIAFAAVMCISIVRSIASSVLGLEEATRRVAAGELDLPIDATGDSEFASLARSLNSLRAQIKEDQAKRARFIMGISHDLKTPLALIKGYAEALEGEMGGFGPEAPSYLGVIQAKSDQLEGMIDDLIDFERVDTGEWRESLSAVKLAPFLRAFVRRIEADAELLGRRALGSVDLPEALEARMDERLATRALENLVFNALRYTQEGGRVEISARLREGKCVVAISDDGPGISAEDLPHIFEPFYRGTSSRREQGMGLGLSIVKTVVESHGWEVSAASEEGRGSTFAVTIGIEGSSSPTRG
jgi:signal transduction histidine kinase